MTVRLLPVLMAPFLGAACALLVSCGGGGDRSELIPDAQAGAMIDQLDAIETAVRNGRCTNVQDNVGELQSEINDLSSDVDARLRARLQEGVNNLAAIAPERCFERRAATPTETIPTQTTPTEVPTQTTPTDTTTETTPTQTTPTQETVPETTPAAPPDTQGSGGATVPDSGEDGAPETLP